MMHGNAWTCYNDEELRALEKLSADYMNFLSEGKTERECVDLIVAMAEGAGYRSLEEVIAAGETLSKGDKVYAVNMNKTVAMFHIGEDIVHRGMNILGAHIDAPRMDQQSPFMRLRAGIFEYTLLWRN